MSCYDSSMVNYILYGYIFFTIFPSYYLLKPNPCFRRRRHEYNHEDDMEILRQIHKLHGYSNLGGNSLWKKMKFPGKQSLVALLVRFYNRLFKTNKI